MRCPSCGYISFDHFASCSKCESDLTGTADIFRGTTTDAEVPFFLGSVVSLSEKRAGADLDAIDNESAAGLDFTLGAGFEDEGELTELIHEPAEESSVDSDIEIAVEANGVVEEIVVEEPAVAPASDLGQVAEDIADLPTDDVDDEEFDMESMFESEEEVLDDKDVESSLDLDLDSGSADIPVEQKAVASEDITDLSADVGDDEEFDIDSMFKSEEKALYGKDQDTEFELDLDIEEDTGDSGGSETVKEETADFDLTGLGAEEIELSDDAKADEAGFDFSNLGSLDIEEDGEEDFDFSNLGSLDIEKDGAADSVDFSALDTDDELGDPLGLDIILDENPDEVSPESAPVPDEPVAKKVADVELNLELASGEDLGASARKEIDKPDIPDLGLKLESEDE